MLDDCASYRGSNIKRTCIPFLGQLANLPARSLRRHAYTTTLDVANSCFVARLETKHNWAGKKLPQVVVISVHDKAIAAMAESGGLLHSVVESGG